MCLLSYDQLMSTRLPPCKKLEVGACIGVHLTPQSWLRDTFLNGGHDEGFLATSPSREPRHSLYGRICQYECQNVSNMPTFPKPCQLIKYGSQRDNQPTKEFSGSPGHPVSGGRTSSPFLRSRIETTASHVIVSPASTDFRWVALNEPLDVEVETRVSTRSSARLDPPKL